MTLGLRGKLFVISLLLIGGVGIITLVFFESRLRTELDGRVEREHRARARQGATAVGLVGLASKDLGRMVNELAESTGSTVAVVSSDGKVLASSAAVTGLPASEDVRAALTGTTSLSRRSRDGRAHIEVAAPVPGDDPPRAVLWMGAEPEDTGSAVRDLRAVLLLAALVGLAVAIFMSGLASELMARTMRTMIDDAVEQATGEAPEHPDDSGDDLVPASTQSFRTIARDLQGAVADLAEERDRLETILEQMYDAVLVLDAERRVTLTNEAANRILMMDDDDVGRPLLEAVRAPALSEIAARAAEGDVDSSVTAEFEIHHPAHRQVLAHAASIRGDGGVVIVMHDVTEVRRLERVRRDFVANVSHELRTPVAIIRANAETLLDGALEDRERAVDFVDGIHRSAERLSLLIGDLLDLSRIEAGQYATQIEPISLRTAVTAAMDGLTPEDGRVAVVNEVTDDASVLADSMGLNQILQNLIDNAVKYVPQDGHVWVRAKAANDAVRIEVQDDGPGIEPHHRRRIFERFYRVDKGRSRQVGGTGLGLAIVKHLAERMGGSVGVDAAPERGSLFWVELPRAG